MAVRNISLVSIGAVAAAVALGWGFSTLGTSDTSVEIQEVSDRAWRVEIEELAPHEEAVAQEASPATPMAN